MPGLDHELITVRAGRRSGLPVILAVHSTALGQAVGGCRVWHYPDWRDGLEDALRLSAGMTRKCAVAGLANGGAKIVVALPDSVTLHGSRRVDVLHDAGDLIESLSGRYATGPDVGTTPGDMAIIGERTRHVFCKPSQRGAEPHARSGATSLPWMRARLVTRSGPACRR